MRDLNPGLIAAELTLVLSSVLIFRSAWMLLDKCPWANSEFGSIALFVAGLAVSVLILVCIHKNKK